MISTLPFLKAAIMKKPDVYDITAVTLKFAQEISFIFIKNLYN